MSSKYSTKQYISARFCAKSKMWFKNVQAFLRYSNFRARIFYFASPCIRIPLELWIYNNNITIYKAHNVLYCFRNKVIVV